MPTMEERYRIQEYPVLRQQVTKQMMNGQYFGVLYQLILFMPKRISRRLSTPDCVPRKP